VVAAHPVDVDGLGRVRAGTGRRVRMTVATGAGPAACDWVRSSAPSLFVSDDPADATRSAMMVVLVTTTRSNHDGAHDTH
jgi:mRNA-degrading endonuclease toxin of MazEF toxin-antitoxin module